MPLISFSGTTSQGPFWKQILEGKKTQTCRKPRKRPIKQGDRLYLYWKVRISPLKKPIHLIDDADCIKVEQRKYKTFSSDDEFARRDGFKDALEMQEWFGDPLEHAEDVYDVIHFKLRGKDETHRKHAEILTDFLFHHPLRLRDGTVV